MPGFTGFGGNSIGGDSQFGHMGSGDPYGSGDITGGQNGHSGDHDTSGTSGTTGSSGNTNGSWAGTGPVNTALINAAILEAIKNGLPRGTLAATSTPSYQAMRAEFDALPVDQQPAARDQINQAWQRAHDAMPDTWTSSRDTGGKNSHTVTITVPNTAKQTQAQAISQVNTDIQGALNLHQEAVAAAQKAAADARAREEEEARQRAAGLSQAEIDAQKRVGAAQAAINTAQGSVNTLNGALSNANQVVTQKQAEMAGLNSQLGTAQQQVNQTQRFANDPVQSRIFFNARAYLVETQNAIANKQNEINSAVASRDSLNTQLSQANTALQNAQNEKAAADTALSVAQGERIAAENKQKEAAAAAAEQKRLADLAAVAAAKAAEDARVAAEQEKARQVRQTAADKLKSGDIQSVRGITASASMAASPLSWAVAGAGGITLGDDIAVAFRTYISAAVAELNGIATASLVGPVAIAVGTLFFSKEAGAGSDQVPGRDISALIPGDALSLSDVSALNQAADTNTPVSMPVRGRMVFRDDGALETQLVRDSVAGSVPVVRASLDPVTGYWGYTLPMLPGVPGQTILVSPADAPGVNGPLGLTGPVPLPERIIHTGDQSTIPQGVTVTTTPVADDLDFADVILIFPADSGLKPLYVMLRSPRNMPGTADGKGQQVGDNWLGSAGTGDGAPIPSQIADKLRGKTYGSFDSFRQAFWKAVADDPELSKQFDADDMERMKLGRAPTVRFRDSVGKRVKVELHHKVEISKGGDVYNVDNLNALTPKRHIEIHKGN